MERARERRGERLAVGRLMRASGLWKGQVAKTNEWRRDGDGKDEGRREKRDRAHSVLECGARETAALAVYMFLGLMLATPMNFAVANFSLTALSVFCPMYVLT